MKVWEGTGQGSKAVLSTLCISGNDHSEALQCVRTSAPLSAFLEAAPLSLESTETPGSDKRTRLSQMLASDKRPEGGHWK
jgi:hypothetical protein